VSDGLIYAAPTGRKLPTAGTDPDHVGSIGVLRRANPEEVELLRRRVREFPEGHPEKRGKTWFDQDGTEFTLLKSYIDPLAPVGVDAFAIRDGFIVGFRRADAGEMIEKSVEQGSISGRRVL
jgi:hypothetical protein